MGVGRRRRDSERRLGQATQAVSAGGSPHRTAPHRPKSHTHIHMNAHVHARHMNAHVHARHTLKASTQALTDANDDNDTDTLARPTHSSYHSPLLPLLLYSPPFGPQSRPKPGKAYA